MKILGINGSLHDISVALFDNGTLINAFEEERFTKEKHQGGVLTGGKMPLNGLNKILANDSLDEIDYICYVGDVYFQPVQIKKMCQEMILFAKQLDPELKKTYFVEHHICHAFSAYAESGFLDAGVLVVDGEGDSCAISIHKFSAGKFQTVLKLPPTSSLGNMYSYITYNLGFKEFGSEGKVMALADYGYDIEEYNNLITYTDNYFEINWEIVREIGNKARNCISFQHKADIAKTLQTALENAMVWLVELTIRLTKSKNVCISGGVAYNCKANTVIWNSGKVNKLFVPNMPGDAGLSIGAAAYVYYKKNNGSAKYTITPYTGNSYNNDDVEKWLTRNGIQYQKSEHIERKCAQLLANGEVVFWFQDKMEFGPRALGNRSILAPINKYKIADYINKEIKHRELWRPFAPCIMEDFVSQYFECSVSSPYMSFAPMIKEQYRELMKEVSSVDGSARVQTVNKKMNERLYVLLKEYAEITNIPIILNTSFNDKNQPMVESIKDAVQMFYASAVRYLIINNIIITK